MIRGSQGFFLLTVCSMAVVVHAETTAQHEARLNWWREARFGMFIHWGPVSLTGQEISWSRANSNTNCPNSGPIPVSVYDNLYKNFNPTNFDAGEWVDIAKSAGMKYMVLTAKHGDGFLLWNSKIDNYNISQTPFHRDVCAELAQAANEKNEKIGWYFSPMDWRDPDCRSTNNDRFVAKIQSELRELLTQYGKICLVWFDLDGRPAMWNPATTYHMVRGLQPGILINNRLEMGSFDEWGHQGRLRPNEDYYTPEQTIGAYDDRTPWETCMTIGTQWAWKPEDKIKSAKEVIHILAQCAGGDGNLLLDVGPMPDGSIEPRQVEVLKQVGDWLAKNGESIYGTRGGPWKPTKAVTSTRKGETVYVHVLRGKTDTIELPDIAGKIKSATLPGGGKIKFKHRRGKLILTIPLVLRDTSDTVVKLGLTSSAMDLPVVGFSEIQTFRATASNVYENDQSDYGAEAAFDGDDETRWATDRGTKRAWIAVEFFKSKAVSHIHISEAYSNRVQKFEFQYRDHSEWKTIFTGTILGDNFQKSFGRISAREFRLNILDSTDAPTIKEIELLP